MKRKIYYIDTNSYGNVHEMFNAASLKSFSLVSSQIKYYAHLSSKKCVCKILGEPLNNLSYYSVPFPMESSKVIYVLKLILTTFYNLLFVIFANRNAILVYNNNNLLSLKPINFINRIFKKKIIVICHGELECLLDENNDGFTKKMLASYFLNKKIHISNNVFYLVLGDSILKYIREIVDDEKQKHFVSVDLPCIFNDTYVHNEFKNDEKIQIGTIGVMAYEKGLEDLLFLDRMFKSSSINLSITGQIYNGLEMVAHSNIDYPNKRGEFLSRDKLNQRLSRLDYVLFLYSSQSYKLTASGALQEAINWDKPIISYKNQYFSYLFNKYGAFGYLVENKEEMVSLFSKIENGDLSDTFDLRVIKKALSPESIAQEIMKVFDYIDVINMKENKDNSKR